MKQLSQEDFENNYTLLPFFAWAICWKSGHIVTSFIKKRELAETIAFEFEQDLIASGKCSKEELGRPVFTKVVIQDARSTSKSLLKKCMEIEVSMANGKKFKEAMKANEAMGVGYG